MEKAGSQRPDEERLGSYEIIRRIARGGMAELYLARTSGAGGFEKVVALKQILPKYATHPRYVQLFWDEARLAASLRHANIVQVYDIGEDRGRYFFAMEYLHGQDLRTILHRAWRDGDKVPIRFAVQIATQVAAALHHAHDMRRPDGSLLEVVHRDVSPSNIVVTYDGAVKLLDFGVAKAATRTVKTRTGTLKGKISYMSPEQAKGAAVDRRSDVFSLGIVLWEMVTTTRLFRGENDLATLQLIINTPPKKPTDYQPECSPELERIILKALAQDITARYQTADELLRDLERFAQDHDIGPSDSALAAYVSSLFPTELSSWEQARAAGVPLAEHLTHVGDMTEPVSESEFIEAIDVAAMLAAEEAEDEAFDERDDDGEGEDDEEDEDEPATATGAIPTPPAAGNLPTPPATVKPPAIPPPRRDATPPPRPPPRIPATGSLTVTDGLNGPTVLTTDPPSALDLTELSPDPPTLDQNPAATTPFTRGGAPTSGMTTPFTRSTAESPVATTTPFTRSTADSPTLTERPGATTTPFTRSGDEPPTLDQRPGATTTPFPRGSGPQVPPPGPQPHSAFAPRAPGNPLRAFATSPFPALAIPMTVVARWERRGLQVLAAVVALIVIIAIVASL